MLKHAGDLFADCMLGVILGNVGCAKKSGVIGINVVVVKASSYGTERGVSGRLTYSNNFRLLETRRRAMGREEH